MRSLIVRASAVVTVMALLTQTACHRGASSASFLSLFGLSKKPVVVALVARPDVLDPFTPHEKLRQAMSESLKRPVRFDLCLPIQLEPNLKLGFYDMALVTPACYVEMSDPDRFDIIAASADCDGRLRHAALLVTPVDSDIQEVADLRGRKVAFGPKHEARTHHAGLALLREHGIEKADLQLSIFPVPGSLKHYSTMWNLALAIQNGEMDAGFIDELAFEEFAADSPTPEDPSRNKLRIIARTKPVPEMLVIKSPKAKPELIGKATDFLLSVGETHPEALRPLLLSAYEIPTADLCAWSERRASEKAPETPPE